MFIKLWEIRDCCSSNSDWRRLSIRDARRRLCRDVTHYFLRHLGLVLTTPEFVREARDLGQLYLLTGEPAPPEE